MSRNSDTRKKDYMHTKSLVAINHKGNLAKIIQNTNNTKIEYFVATNSREDVIALYESDGTIVCRYVYDAWGNVENVLSEDYSSTITNTNHIANINPILYRGYYYDRESGLYYLNSRYYDSEVGRFINSDNQITIEDSLTKLNLYSYCGNNPVNRIDPTGESWVHWILGATIVAACAVATVVTCGSFVAAVSAVSLVSSGLAAATTTSTIAAGAFIGATMAYGTAVISAAYETSTIQEFGDKGNWGTVATTLFGAIAGGATSMSNSHVSVKNNASFDSTRRTEPSDLIEKLAMEQVKSNPLAGTPITKLPLKDPRWPSSKGWVKMQQIVHTSKGDINIHYVYNSTINIFDDFKFNP